MKKRCDHCLTIIYIHFENNRNCFWSPKNKMSDLYGNMPYKRTVYFSDVSGWKSIPISVPGPYECLEWYRLLVFFTPNNFCFAPNSHNAPAAPLACQMDLCLSWPHWFVRQTNPWVLFLHKSIWNTHGAAGALWLFGAKLKLLVVKKQVAYTILGTQTVLGH